MGHLERWWQSLMQIALHSCIALLLYFCTLLTTRIPMFVKIAIFLWLKYINYTDRKEELNFFVLLLKDAFAAFHTIHELKQTAKVNFGWRWINCLSSVKESTVAIIKIYYNIIYSQLQLQYDQKLIIIYDLCIIKLLTYSLVSKQLWYCIQESGSVWCFTIIYLKAFTTKHFCIKNNNSSASFFTIISSYDTGVQKNPVPFFSFPKRTSFGWYNGTSAIEGRSSPILMSFTGCTKESCQLK